MEQIQNPSVGIIMGSQTDWNIMQHAATMLESLKIAHEVRIISAHRTPDVLMEYASTAEDRGLQVIIAGAGGAAHLPGVTAAKTLVPVLGVPIDSSPLLGLDALLAIVQMPAGIPVGTLAVGKAGAINAAVFAAQIIALKDKGVKAKIEDYRQKLAEKVLSNSTPQNS